MTTEYSGSGDARRTLELLWGVQPQPRRGPKPKLTARRIVEAAITVADAEGLAALSMRRVAEELSVAAMSLYTYVPSKAELIDLMLDTVQAELPLLDDLPGTWRERMTAWARASMASYHRHPWVLQVNTVHPPMGPNEMTSAEAAMRALTGIGLTDHEVMALRGAIDGYIRGVARSLVDAAQVEARTGLSDEAWDASRNPYLEKVITPDRFPIMTRMHADGVFESPLDVFDFGLQRLLDGVEATLTSRRAQP
ncbi:TetR/AcrR family transcriptional regulator [Nonomuraea sp. NPDC000554]|uniref:TetR/AcrR family transcriptional regulator n=1 Tax=Nonomuraea sp. NPDC000554 TaxID=3154259 RepID=UPI003325F932